MKWLGVLIICGVIALVPCVLAWYGKGLKLSIMIISYLLFTAFLFGLASAVMFGLTLIVKG